MKKGIKNYFRTGAMVLLSLLFCVEGYTLPPSYVTADPALAGMDISNLDNSPANANMLGNGQTYLLKVTFENNHPGNAIPTGTARLKIGLGINFVLDPSFNVNAGGYSQYITWSYDNSQSQPQIIGTIHSDLPALFLGEAVFRVKAGPLGASTATGNFLVANPPGTPAILIDNISNNTADIEYNILPFAPTPVTLTKFTASKTNCIIRSEWSVENEINFDRYELQASKDGSNYSTVNTSMAASKKDYGAAIDISTLSSLQGATLYLRLKMIDKNGSYKYSDIVPVSGQCDSRTDYVITGYPNPVLNSDNRMTIAIKDGLFNGRYVVTVTDMAGRVYVTRDVVLDNVSSFRFDFGKVLAHGLYNLSLQQPGGKQKASLQFEKL